MTNNMLENLKLLKEDMKNKKLIILSFYFLYKSNKYIVLVNILNKSKEIVPKYVLVKLEFLRENNFLKYLVVYANLCKLFIEDMKLFRKFFVIEYSNNLGDIILQFNKILSEYIFIKVTNN